MRCLATKNHNGKSRNFPLTTSFWKVPQDQKVWVNGVVHTSFPPLNVLCAELSTYGKNESNIRKTQKCKSWSNFQKGLIKRNCRLFQGWFFVARHIVALVNQISNTLEFCTYGTNKISMVTLRDVLIFHWRFVL